MKRYLLAAALGALFGATATIYLRWNDTIFMWHDGALSTAQDAYDYTCGNHTWSNGSLKNDDEFWQDMLKIDYAAQQKAEKAAFTPDFAFLPSLTAAEAKIVSMCDYLKNDELKVAKKAAQEDGRPHQ